MERLVNLPFIDIRLFTCSIAICFLMEYGIECMSGVRASHRPLDWTRDMPRERSLHLAWYCAARAAYLVRSRAVAWTNRAFDFSF